MPRRGHGRFPDKAAPAGGSAASVAKMGEHSRRKKIIVSKPTNSTQRMIDTTTLAMFRSMQPAGKPSLLVELLDLYLEHSPARVRDAEKACAARDPLKLKHAVHTLKGSSQNLGATAVGKICREIEELLGESDWEKIEAKLQVLSATFDSSCKEMKAIRDAEPKPPEKT